MALKIKHASRVSAIIVLILLCAEAKLSEDKTNVSDTSSEEQPSKPSPKPQVSGGAAILFADELRVVLERYLFGICPQTFKMQLGSKLRTNSTAMTCDVDAEQHELAARLATLALRAHAASRDCGRLASTLANTLSDLARTANNRQALSSAISDPKKRKLSKSQKLKIQAKQRTAIAVKKKAAAAAAAAAAKMS